MALPNAINFEGIQTRNLFSEAQSSFVLFFDIINKSKNSFPYLDELRSISKKYKHTHIYIGTCHDINIANIYGINQQDMPMLMQLGKDEPYAYNISGKLTKEKMESFIDTHKCTLQLEIARGYWREALDCFKSKIVGISFVSFSKSLGINNPKHAVLLMDEFRKKNDNRFQLAYVDIDKYPEIMKEFNITQIPSFIIADYRQDMHYKDFGEFDLRDFSSLKAVFNKMWDNEDVSKFIKTQSGYEKNCELEVHSNTTINSCSDTI